MQQQLPLEFKFNNELTFENFIPGSNTQLIEVLKNLASVDDIPFVFIWGNGGVGKTHLLQALCQSPSFEKSPVAMIPLIGEDEEESYSAKILDGLENMALVCIDDIESIAGDADWEEALFHFYNRARDMKMPVVVSANCPPTQLRIKLADLKTRLGWGLVFELRELNDAEKLQMMQLMARHRGMELNDEVGEYLLKRVSRSTSDLIGFLDELDKATLSEQRRLTIPFIKQLLESS